MSNTIKSRIEGLEAKQGTPDYKNYDYEMVITWDENEQPAKYYKDGIEITQEQYQAEAPKGPSEIIVDWGEPIPSEEAKHDQ